MTMRNTLPKGMAGKKRVLHVLPDLMPYGLEKMVASMALLADTSRFEPAVVSLYGRMEGSLADRLESNGVQVFHLDKHRGLDVRMFPRLHRVMREFRPHVVHTHNYVLRYTLPVTMLVRPAVQIHTIHNVAQHEVDRVGLWLQRAVFRSGWVTPVAIADEVAGSVKSVYGIAEPVNIPNGIPVQAFAPKSGLREQWRRENGFGQDEVLIVCVARFYPQKNHATLLQAFAASGSAAQARLLLAGDGVLEEEIRTQASELGISSRVHFLGRRDDIPAILAAADIAALASLWEGNPLSVMEAMAAGKACAMTSVGAIPELIEDGRSGLLAVPGDAASLAEQLRAFVEDTGLRTRMGEAARRRAMARFDHSVMVSAYEDLYERELRGAGARQEDAVVA
jgi:glycosyltransferase involved in cell wall biosynthesis